MTIIQNALITATISNGGSGFNLFESVPLYANGTLFAHASSDSGKITGVKIDSPGSGLLDGRYPINGETIDVGYVDVLNGQVVSGHYVKDSVYSGRPAVTVNIPFDYTTWPSSSVGVHTTPSLSAIVQGALTSVIPDWETVTNGQPQSFGTNPVITFGGPGTGAVLTPVIADYTVPGTTTDTGSTGGTNSGSGSGSTTPSVSVTNTTSVSNLIIPASAISAIIGNSSHDIFVREAVSIDVEIDFPDNTLVNDETDPDVVNHAFGWRTWQNPSQTDLDADLKSPDNIWEPIYGEYVPVGTLSTDYLKKIKAYQEAKLVLNSGSEVDKYKSIWSDFVQLNDIFLERIFDGQETSRTFAIATSDKSIDTSRLFVYVDGVLQSLANVKISKLNVELTSAINVLVGSKIVVIYKKYQPSASELAFDPETKDDYLVNTQYKFGYDYTSFEIRDSNDRLTQSVYYFWVKNKNTPAVGHKMSIQQAKNLLTYGPSLYMTFHDIKDASGSLPIRYDAISIFGLNKFATRDDTYKLRFTRNFTLRDDPNELDLKNVHAEWALIRPAQNVRIPLNLWDKLVDSAVGQDVIGNTVPYTYLSDYDEQHGTSNRFGLGQGQVLANKESVVASIKHTILNTNLTINLGGTLVPDYIQNLKLSQLDKYFDTPESIRQTLDFIWRQAKPKQINEIFFAVINDALANNFEFKDVFKTSRLSVYSIKTVEQILTGTDDE